MSYYFQLLTPRESIIYGKKLKTSGSGIRPGILVKLNEDGETVSKCDEAEYPFGFAFGARSMVYGPTTEVYDVGEVLSVVQGSGLVAMGSYFFTSGSGFADEGDQPVYTADGGLLTPDEGDTNTKVARFIRRKSRTTPVGGVGGSEDVAILRFNIQP